jgi:hypothetical protein
MAELPPDLEALGEALTRATTRAGALRRHRLLLRRKLLASIGAGILMFAAMTPSQLGNSDQVPLLLQQFTTAPAAASSFGCDRPRGHGAYRSPDCDAGPAQPQAAR